MTIEAHDFLWSPDTVTIQVGDTVTWTNEQGIHNVLLGDSRHYGAAGTYAVTLTVTYADGEQASETIEVTVP